MANTIFDILYESYKMVKSSKKPVYCFVNDECFRIVLTSDPQEALRLTDDGYKLFYSIDENLYLQKGDNIW